jgi:hypothetical protein
MQNAPWYVINGHAGSQVEKHLFAEHELTKALRMYGQVRRDLPGGYRIELRWVEQGAGNHHQPFDGQVWRGAQPLAQGGDARLTFLLGQLRTQCENLDPPLLW